MKANHYILLLFALSTWSACKKDNKAGTAPAISLVSVSSTSLKEFKDSLTILISYTDEDGDIGQENPDINDLKVKDRRLSEADYYFVKPLAPPDSKISIHGTIAIQIKNTFLLGTGNSEITQFDVQLRDRAGHWSNTVNTPQITINR
ncbi:MAG: hypothetical protein JNM67_06205 [Bacteroidetes bacterium]|jgi:hypothetical protein|nr:hypothetical protein [Bacteroidota bacterium]